MNEVIKTILERRSIRSYQNTPLPASDLTLIIQAGLYAASARGIQPWHITVVQNPDVITRINEELRAATTRIGGKYQAMLDNPNYSIVFKSAPVFAIVSVNPAITNCPFEDGALVLGNMFLAAHSLGIGSCWVNQLGDVDDEPQFRALLTELGVPQDYQICGCVSLGYPDGPAPAPKPRKEGTVNYVK